MIKDHNVWMKVRDWSEKSKLDEYSDCFLLLAATPNFIRGHPAWLLFNPQSTHFRAFRGSKTRAVLMVSDPVIGKLNTEARLSYQYFSK